MKTPAAAKTHGMRTPWGCFVVVFAIGIPTEPQIKKCSAAYIIARLFGIL
jgi:hypothetical protein